MSKKTFKQRIAVVAVSALTAGLFSVVSTPVANSAIAQAGTLALAITNSTTGSNVVTAGGGDTTLDKSIGFVSMTSATAGGQAAIGATAIELSGGTVGTGVALNSGKLVFSTTASTAVPVGVVVSGGSLSSAVSRNTTAIANTALTSNVVTITTATAHGLAAGNIVAVTAVSATGVNGTFTIASVPTTTTFTYALTATNITAGVDTGTVTPVAQFNGSNTAVVRQIATNPSLAIVATPAPGATSMTVSAYQGASVTAADPTNGTLMGRFVITIVAAGSTGTFQASTSPVAITTSATATQITSSADASISGVSAGNPLFIQVIGTNPYGSALAAGTYVATATNAATVAWGNAAAATAAGTLSVATVTPDGTDQLRIDPASSLTTTTTTVTITHDGLPVATKNLTFYGEVKKIVIEKVVPGQTSTSVSNADSATAYAVYSYRDSADGKVPGPAALFVATTANSTITNGVSARIPSRSVQAKPTSNMSDAVETLIGTGTDGIFAFTCGSTPRAADATITHTNAITGTALTATVTGIGCYGPLDTYTVSTDKAKYAVGEIATITILGKDVLGNPVPDNQTLAINSISVGGGSLAVAVAATDVFTAGKAVYKAQMTTAGTFNTVVSLTGLTTTSATAGYSVTSGDVSNAEVLKSIVALIASINKQIAALQKLILKR